ncbi:CRISPR-associated protein Cas4 [Candidatus Woesearchaeota archaeon]|nr:CRISPR-associated protein Cas4 [Candidatus Woesearchaeota archaeon]
MISPTAISTYLYCPRKLFLERVLKLFKLPKEVMVKGNVKHAAYEEINNKEEEIVVGLTEKDYDSIFEAYKRVFSQIIRRTINNFSKELREHGIDELEFFKGFWPALVFEAEERAKNVQKFIKKHDFLGEKLWEELTPKIVSELSISDAKIGLRGIVDEVRDYKIEVVPVELKSGKSPSTGVWPGHKAQIASYMLLLRSQGKTVKEGMVKYIDEKKEVIIPYNTLLEDELKKQIVLVRGVLKKKDIPPFVDSANKCAACQLKEDCYNKEFISSKLLEKGIITN